MPQGGKIDDPTKANEASDADQAQGKLRGRLKPRLCLEKSNGRFLSCLNYLDRRAPYLDGSVRGTDDRVEGAVSGFARARGDTRRVGYIYRQFD